jgi:hypothetical protein
VSFPQPLANYLSTISVTADANGSTFNRVANDVAKGVLDTDAKKVIDCIYDVVGK